MGELPRYFVPSTTSPYEGLVVFFMGEPIPEGPVKTNVTVNVNWMPPKEDEELKLCEARCGAQLVKRKVLHECILRRGHEALFLQHVCNCGEEWVGVDVK